MFYLATISVATACRSRDSSIVINQQTLTVRAYTLVKSHRWMPPQLFSMTDFVSLLEMVLP